MDFKNLFEAVKNAVVSTQRLTDVKNNTVCNISIEGEKQDRIYLVGKPNGKYALPTPATLAGLRIAESANAVKNIETTREARTSEHITTLQSTLIAKSITELTPNTKFTVVHQLKVMGNDEKPVYKNDCYNGYQQYVKDARAASLLEGNERTVAFIAASEALRDSGVKEEKKLEANILRMPVFTVSAS